MGLNLLLVEGEGGMEWEKVRAYFRKKGFAVYQTASVKEAYRVLRNEPIHIVLADFRLSGINGISFLAKIKKTVRPQVEVIFLSGRVPLSAAIEAMKAGAYDFHEFPLNHRLLMAVVEKAREKQSLFVEKVELERKVRERFNFGNIVGRSKPMQHVIEIVGSVAPKNVNILLAGETGTGKEMIANAIHYNSPRSSKPFIKVNCAAFNEGVLESELFGHEKGSFTGAISKRLGRFELANGGTIFLDEIGDVPPQTQIKLLRVLQEKEFERVGGNETIKVDVRVIAATNQDLKKLIDSGKFREDLYYRLNVVRLELPPLRERKEDIALLVSYFINKLNEEKDYRIKGITKETMQLLLAYRWPGNVRELENALESAMALAEKDVIEARYLPAFLSLAQPQNGDHYHIPIDLPLREIEREVIKHTLDRAGGNKSLASKLLGIGLRTLQRKAKEFQ
ncbi:MAG: sigma-54 dependent transcriptional regulator [Nitrospiraceae bacterium]|nr:sigma-54 dependent transcriptional regulator [Nitrospiraceae bacterium]